MCSSATTLLTAQTRRKWARRRKKFRLVDAQKDVTKPTSHELLHERRNGQFLLQVTGHPQSGVPWGQDRLVPIFLATLAVRQQKQTITFRSAAEMLDVFGLPQGGSQYRRLISSFQRVFGATIFFGTDTQREKAMVSHHARFNFMRKARIWYSRNPRQEMLPGGFENEIVLSDEFFREVTAHSIPTDLEAAKALSSSPAALDLFMCSPIVALQQKAKSEFQYLVISGWQINWEALTMHVPASSESDWSGGSTWSGHCGRFVRLASHQMASASLLSRR